MKLTFLGGAREVGRSGVLLESDKRVLFDYGIKIHGSTEFPLFPKQRIDAAIITHAHLDHSGHVPYIFQNYELPVYATYPTQALCDLLIKDAVKVQESKGFRVPFSKKALKRALNGFIPLIYGKRHQFSKMAFTLHDAGHIPGAAIIEAEVEGKRVVYTGDFKMEETHLHEGAQPVEDVDVLMIESTYSRREHPDRKTTEEQLCSEITATLEEGGTVLLPCFAVGRSQEILSILYEHDRNIRPYVDGMARAASSIFMDYPSYLKDARMLRAALQNAFIVNSFGERKRALKEPSVIISPAGMLEGGHAINYLLNLPKNGKVIFTGFSVEDTNGWRLQNKGFVHIDGRDVDVSQPVRYADLSAHAGRKDLLAFIKKANPEKIFCMHGDSCEEFSKELLERGYEACAPKMGETFTV